MSSTTSQGEMLALFARHWKRLAAFALLGLGAGIAYALVAPKYYEAMLTVVQSQRSQDSAAMSIASKMPIALDAISTDVMRINAVLTSTSVADEVIQKFDLDKYYGTPYREQTRKALSEHCTTSVDRKSGVVALTCEDEDPERAMQLAVYFGEVGNRIFRRVSASSAREERAFLETQTTQARRDVEESSKKLRDFQAKHKIVDLPEQSKAVISAMASIKGDLISKQLELSYLRSFSASSEASVIQLQQQIAIMESKLAQLEAAQLANASAGSATGSAAGSSAGSSSAKNTDFFPGAMTVPELRFELEGLLREQKIRETVFALMTQRYEMARVDEARDTSTFQILDHPTRPTYHSRPKKRRIAFLGLLLGVCIGAASVMAPLWWRRFLEANRIARQS